MTATATATKSADFVISRVLNAPRDLVWKCFTDPEHMKVWWGPKGFTGVSSKMDFRPDGRYHYGLKSPDGMTMYFSSRRPNSHGPAGTMDIYVSTRERRR